jgi:hypothetical protein
LDHAPPQYLLFLLVPLVATTWGGWVAARRAGARGRPSGVKAGLLAGVVFALGVLVTEILARVSFQVIGPTTADVYGAIGPDVIPGALLALAWGMAGGAAGGALAARSSLGRAAEPDRAAGDDDGSCE